MEERTNEDSNGMGAESPTLFLRDIVCENQGKYIQFAFSAGEAHKALSKALQDDNVPEIEASLGLLTALANTSILLEARATFAHMQRYFSSTSASRKTPNHTIPPRICLKLLKKVKRGRRNATLVFTRARHDAYPENDKRFEQESDAREYLLNAHSIFYHIYQYGSYYVENDIPEAFDTKGYENARIEKDEAKAYYRHREGRGSDEYPDEAWLKCWKTPSFEKRKQNPRCCYKSTLVVPVTLKGHVEKGRLDPLFLEAFRKKVNAPKEDFERLIFGFVCMDHVDIDYFLKKETEPDVHMGYVAADLISLYLTAKMLLVDYSETVLRAKKRIPRKRGT